MEAYEIERERKRVWSKKKPPSKVVVVMSQPCQFRRAFLIDTLALVFSFLFQFYL